MANLKEYKLGNIANIVVSNVDKKTTPNQKTVKLCNFVDVYYNWAITKSNYDSFMTATASDEEISKFSLKKGQVAFTKDSETRDDIGIPAYIAEDFKDVVLGYHTALATPNENIVTGEYLNAFMHSSYIQKYFELNATGSGMRYTLSQQTLHDIPILAPDLDAQHKIGSLLSKIDRKISINREINRNLEELAKQIYDYWFVQFDFPNEEGKPYKSSGGKMVWNETLKREIPAGWKNGVLSNIAYITMGQSPEGSSYNEDGIGTIFYQGSTDFGIRFPNVRMYTTKPTRFAKIGDILMSVRAPVGAMNIANSDCCIGRGLSAMNSKIGSITHLYYTMDYFRHTFENKNAVGTTFGSITKDELYNLPVVIPSKEVISAFNVKTIYIFNQQLSTSKEIQELTALRDSLLPLLMNGQVTLNSCLSHD